VSDMTRLMTALVSFLNRLEKFTPTGIFNSLIKPENIDLMDIAFKSLDQLMIEHKETSTNLSSHLLMLFDVCQVAADHSIRVAVSS
jgi:hypothetical protein